MRQSLAINLDDPACFGADMFVSELPFGDAAAADDDMQINLGYAVIRDLFRMWREDFDRRMERARSRGTDEGATCFSFCFHC